MNGEIIANYEHNTDGRRHCANKTDHFVHIMLIKI